RHAVLFFFSNAPPPTPTYALSLHDALPIYGAAGGEHRAGGAAAREDAALGDDGVLGDAAAAVGVALAEHELRGRQVPVDGPQGRSEEHTSELQSRENLVCRLLLEKKNEWTI